METRICSKCGEEREAILFEKNRKQCKLCRNEVTYESAKRNSSRLNAVRRNNVQEKFAFVARIKESMPCTDCEKYYPYYVMDFDHIKDNKFKNVTKMVSQNYSLRNIEKEIAKCELVCANCHRKRTHTRWYKDGHPSAFKEASI